MIIILTPTYNEKDNLPLWAEKVVALGLNDYKMVVVDDNSPDGTSRVAHGLARKYPLRVIDRPQKEGLGRAYIAAFKDILANENPEYIIHMDADLSHDAAAIPSMLEKIKENDLVLGSRYIKGGGVVNWNFVRRMISRFGNVYARFVLGISYRDLTGGFKCWRSSTLRKIDYENVSSVGYNFQIEMTYMAHRNGAKIIEVPITFRERKLGASKFDSGIISESFVKVLLLRFRD